MTMTMTAVKRDPYNLPESTSLEKFEGPKTEKVPYVLTSVFPPPPAADQSFPPEGCQEDSIALGSELLSVTYRVGIGNWKAEVCSTGLSGLGYSGTVPLGK